MFPIEAFRATLEKAVDLFQRHAVRFHLTGGITSVAYGEPRMTQDVDIVIDNAAITKAIDHFLESLAYSDFMHEPEAIRAAVSNKGMFQLLDNIESLKLDVYPRELIPGELDRSESAVIFPDRILPIASRSDSAVSKLIWVSKGSHKSRRDFRQIYRTSNKQDRELILDLARELNLESLFEELLAEPDEIID